MNTIKKITHILTAGLAFWAGFALDNRDARADYTLADGEVKTFASSNEFGALSQNVTGPTTEGSMATLNFTNVQWSNINYITGAISGNITLVMSGTGETRLSHDYSTGATAFTGPTYIENGALYFHYGQELGTGTIYLKGGTLSNGGDNWNSVTHSTMTNDLVFVDGTTSYIRFAYTGTKGGNVTLAGNISGTGTAKWGMLYTGAREQTPSVVTLAGESTHSGKTVFNHDYNGKKNVANYNVQNTTGFGTGEVEVNDETVINYQKNVAGAVIDRNITHTSLVVSDGKTLTLKNGGGGKVNISTRWLTSNGNNSTVDLSESNIHLTLAGKSGETLKGTIKIASGSSLAFTGEKDQSTNINMSISNAGTIKIENGNFSLANSIVNNGKITLGKDTILGVGAYDSTTGDDLNITGTGSIQLDGDLMISAFSPTDYDTIAFADTQNVTLGNDFALILSLPDDTSEFNEKQNTLDVFSGLNDTTMFQNVDLYFSQSGWYGYINGNGQVVFGASNAVPEPSTWVLLALATLGIGYLRKR